MVAPACEGTSLSLTAVATFLLVPPINLIFIGAVGLALCRRRFGRWLAGLALAGLCVLAMPASSGALIAALEYGLPGEGAGKPAAIIVLGAEVTVGRDPAAAALPGRLTLERLRAGAALQRETGLPILVSGGIVRRDAEPVATVMARSLTGDFGVPVSWVEARSNDTWENAAFSATILNAAGIHNVYVVSQAWHLRRALIAMRHFGLAATPAPTQYDALPSWRLDAFVPQASALLMSYYALHEWIGCVYYALRG